MDQGTKLLGIYVLVSLIVFGACLGTWLAYNNAKRPTPTPTVTLPAKSQQTAPGKAQGTPKPQSAQPVQPIAQATPMPRWTDYPGSGGLIHYRVEPLSTP